MNTFLTVLDFIGAALMLGGAIFLLIGGIGLITLNDMYSRMHAAAKPQWLGVFLIASGTALSMRTWQWLAAALLMVILQTLSAPVGAHMMARSAYRNQDFDPASLVKDELAEDIKAEEDRRAAMLHCAPSTAEAAQIRHEQQDPDRE
ncbi:MAG TPA: monovalent cation/H(+) antiporter subunit G [Actinomyces sp.]|jgi:multicomponent Na+:H+ antiporter subunit G|nr:monovalent cation/H(+) antiporter subunit G [Acidobacteriota bacterium]HHT40323.1 monovalent cation/H(+) antiporter subunit G [Actinomyces sp.]